MTSIITHPTTCSPTTNQKQIYNQQKTTVALLFLTKGNHEQDSLWKAFLKQHNPSQPWKFSVYCHPQSDRHIPKHSFLRRSGSSSSHTKCSTQEGLLPMSLRVNKPYTRWAHLTLAYYALLKRAYNDTANNNVRFVFLSDTCVPCVDPEKAFKELTADLDCTYYHTTDPSRHKERYESTDACPWRSHYPHKLPANSPPLSCADALKDAGILKEHFFKHSGWFALSKKDTEKMLSCRDAFQALNHVPAGDEHILSILKRPQFSATTRMENRQITMVTWNKTFRDEYTRLSKVHTDEFWKEFDTLPDSQYKTTYLERWKNIKEAEYHPISYTTKFTPTMLKQCRDASSLFVRKVRSGCDVSVLFHAIQHHTDSQYPNSNSNGNGNEE